MPIVLASHKPTLTEVGRIRIGHKVSGKRPEKLEKFRLTSPHRDVLEAVAKKYGGTVEEWNDPAANPSNQYEVYTTSNAIEVTYILGECDSYLERWSRGGCDLRTDGEFLYDGFNKTTRPYTGPTDKDGLAAANIRPVTRIAFMLTGIPSLGTWRLETHGFYAEKELTGITQLVEMLATSRVVAGTLVLEARKSTSNGKTNRFQVPTLNFPILPEELVEAERRAIEDSFNQQVAFEKANTPKGLTAGVGMTADDIAAEYDGVSRPTPPVRDTSLPRVANDRVQVKNLMSTEDQHIEIRALANALGLTAPQLVEALRLTFPNAGISKVEHLQQEQAQQVIQRMSKKVEALNPMPVTTNEDVAHPDDPFGIEDAVVVGEEVSA